MAQPESSTREQKTTEQQQSSANLGDPRSIDLSARDSAQQFDRDQVQDFEVSSDGNAPSSFDEHFDNFDPASEARASTGESQERSSAARNPEALDLDALSPAERKQAENLLKQADALQEAEAKARISLARRLSKLKRPTARNNAIRNAQKASLGREQKLANIREQLSDLIGEDGLDNLDNNQPEPDQQDNRNENRRQDHDTDNEKKRSEPEENKRPDPNRNEREDRQGPDQNNRPNPEPHDRPEPKQNERPEPEQDRREQRLTPEQQKQLSSLEDQISRLETKDRRAETSYQSQREKYVRNGKTRAVQVLDAKFRRADANREQRLDDLRSEAKAIRDFRDGESRPQPDNEREHREENRREQEEERREAERRDSERRDSERREQERRETERREQEHREQERVDDPFQVDRATEQRLGQRSRELLRRASSGELPATDAERLKGLLANGNFDSLTPEEQAKVVTLYTSHQTNAGQLDVIVQVATSDYFARYSTRQQTAALELFEGRDVRWLDDVAPAWQKAICDQLAGSGSIAREKTLAILDSDGFQDLALVDIQNSNNSNRLQVLNVIFNSSTEGQTELLNALEARRGRPPQTVLLSRDSEGHTALSNLHELAVADKFFDKKLVVQRKELMRSMTEALARAGEVNQGSKGTCAATDPLWHFTNTDPGEISRVFTDLILDGSSDFRRENRSCVLEPESYKSGVNSNTTLFDQIMSASFMEHANAGTLDYRYDKDTHLKQGTNEEGQDGGLYQHQQRRLLESFYDRDFETHHRSDGLEDLMTEMTGHLKTDSVHTVLRWHDAGRTTIGEDDKHSYHAVSVIGMKKDENGEMRVYMRNPWGESDRENGVVVNDRGPARRMEDNTNGIESMTLAEFRRRVTSINVPKTDTGWNFQEFVSGLF